MISILSSFRLCFPIFRYEVILNQTIFQKLQNAKFSIPNSLKPLQIAIWKGKLVDECGKFWANLTKLNRKLCSSIPTFEP